MRKSRLADLDRCKRTAAKRTEPTSVDQEEEDDAPRTKACRNASEGGLTVNTLTGTTARTSETTHNTTDEITSASRYQPAIVSSVSDHKELSCSPRFS